MKIIHLIQSCRQYYLFAISLLVMGQAMALPPGFVYLKDIDPTIIQEIRYDTNNNFVGRRIAGYEAPECILTKKAAMALSKVQQRLRQQSLGLLVYDCYRPQTAVNDFIAWSHNPHDQKMKLTYYPRINKADLFRLDYIAARSGHTRGSTVDLTVVHYPNSDLKPVPKEMGTPFDYLDPLSHPLSSHISQLARRNQLFLRNIMYQAGFVPIKTEWWHYSLRDEPYPNTYFDFPVRG